MQNLTILSTEIRQLDGLYSLNDLHKASGGAARHLPNRFLRLDQTRSLASEIEQTPDVALGARAVHGGPNRGTYACRELVVAYAAWISPAFHLKVLRVFLDTQAPQPSAARKVNLESDPRFVEKLAEQLGEDLVKAGLRLSPQKTLRMFVLIYADALWHKRMRPAFTDSLVRLVG